MLQFIPPPELDLDPTVGWHSHTEAGGLGIDKLPTYGILSIDNPPNSGL
jgi:hypothetical protein